MRSWGNYPRVEQTAVALTWRDQPLPPPASGGSVLAYGMGRSYGDSCLNAGSTLLLTRSLDRFLAFDQERGVLSCEAGVTLGEVLDLVVPAGWFLPVTPGTKYVTVGGALANDVHGKNHHLDGTFGHAVRRFELLRTDGRHQCSPTENPALFQATIGGLGLTGLVTWVEFDLKPIPGPWIDQEVIRFGTLAEFFQLSAASAAAFAYTVAWIDCLAAGAHLGRGLFMRGNHAAAPAGQGPVKSRRQLAVPCNLPEWALNGLTVKLFNRAYYGRHRGRCRRVTPYEPFFYPLDRIQHWNRIYGRRGFFQYQCVVPLADADATVRGILGEVARAGAGSFLSVLKLFGAKPSLGLLSFPRPGVTLALDFPNTGAAALALLERLDDLTRAAGGAVYPAKDARMSGAAFRQFYPRWSEFASQVDPGFSSSFWRRVTAT